MPVPGTSEISEKAESGAVGIYKSIINAGVQMKMYQCIQNYTKDPWLTANHEFENFAQRAHPQLEKFRVGRILYV